MYQNQDRESLLIAGLLSDGVQNESEKNIVWLNKVSADIFTHSFNRYIFDVMMFLRKKRRHVSKQAIINFIEKDVDNPNDYIQVIESYPNVKVDIPAEIDYLTDLSDKRKLLEIADQINQNLLSGEDVEDIKRKVNTSMFKLSGIENDDTINLTLDNLEASVIAIQSMKKVPYAVTNLKDWDEHVPLMRDTLTTITANSSVGKTTFTVDILNRAMKYNDDVVVKFFSWDVSKTDLMKNFISNICKITIPRLNGKFPKLTETEVINFREAVRIVNSLPLFIENVPLTPEELFQSCQAFKYEHPNKHIIFALDHHINFKQQGALRETIIHGTQACKDAAKQLNATFILLAQQRRLDELKRGKTDMNATIPSKYFIQESGAVEMESDNIVCLWRPILHQQLETIPDTHSMMGIIDKKRFGALHTMEFSYTPKYGLLENIDNSTDLPF